MNSTIVMEEITDEKELAEARKRRRLFDRNFAWFEAHSREIYQNYRGKCVVIADEEIFSADTPEEAWNLSKAAHPTDDGRFIHYIPKQKAIRIYGNWR